MFSKLFNLNGKKRRQRKQGEAGEPDGIDARAVVGESVADAKTFREHGVVDGVAIDLRAYGAARAIPVLNESHLYTPLYAAITAGQEEELPLKSNAKSGKRNQGSAWSYMSYCGCTSWKA